MKPIRIYLDEAKERGIAKNDSDIARKLEVTPQAVSKWRKGDDAPAEDTAARLAEMLGKPEVMAECAAARAKTPEGRRMWERLARIAAAAVVVVAVTPHNTYASASQYAPCIQGLTVFRTARASAARALAGLSIRFRRIFQQCGTVRFAAGAHGCVGA